MNNSATRKDRATNFTFLGLTGSVTVEDMAGGLSDKKTYTYDAYGHRISMVDDPAGTSAGPKTYTYGYDVHGSVSTLLDDATGTVKATYGYDAYGSPDGALTDDVTGDELLEVLREIGEEFRHILYHVKDPKFYRYLNEHVGTEGPL